MVLPILLFFSSYPSGENPPIFDIFYDFNFDGNTTIAFSYHCSNNSEPVIGSQVKVYEWDPFIDDYVGTTEVRRENEDADSSVGLGTGTGTVYYEFQCNDGYFNELCEPYVELHNPCGNGGVYNSIQIFAQLAELAENKQGKPFYDGNIGPEDDYHIQNIESLTLFILVLLCIILYTGGQIFIRKCR